MFKSGFYFQAGRERPVETILHPLSSHRGRGHCPWNGALHGRRQVIKWLHPHLHGAVKEYL
jgi:hypothetical protein